MKRLASAVMIKLAWRRNLGLGYGKHEITKDYYAEYLALHKDFNEIADGNALSLSGHSSAMPGSQFNVHRTGRDLSQRGKTIT